MPVYTRHYLTGYSQLLWTAFCVVLMFIFSSVLDRFDGVPDWIRIALFFGLWAVYEPLCTSLGGTLGNHFKGIRVRRAADTSRRLSFFAAFIRYVLKISLGWISFLTIHSNPHKRAIHDFASGSVMIQKQVR
jgi:uncharacterized RDD family membrane protein YckC